MMRFGAMAFGLAIVGLMSIQPCVRVTEHCSIVGDRFGWKIAAEHIRVCVQCADTQ